MTELPHSNRVTLQATYTPIKLPPTEHAESNSSGRALEKYGFVSSLKPTITEVAELKSQLEASPAPAPTPSALPHREALHLIERAVAEPGLTVLRSAPLFANSPRIRLQLLGRT